MCQGNPDCSGRCSDGSCDTCQSNRDNNRNIDSINNRNNTNNNRNSLITTNNSININRNISTNHQNRISMTMGDVVRGGSNLNEVGVVHHVPHYASTPHLFVYQAADDEDGGADIGDDVDHAIPCKDPKEPIYSSAIDIRKVAASKEAEAVHRITEKYDSLRALTDRREEIEDPLAVTEEDVQRIETFFRGHKTQLWVCRTMANLYNEGGVGSTHGQWELKYTGVPLLLLDQGDTKSRDKRRLQLILAEKGTGFALWRDIVDNLTSYRAQEPQFHTLYLSSDHRRRMGFSFNDARPASEFLTHIERLTADPANISLSGPSKKKNKVKEKILKYKAPKKTDISTPCNFHHVTTVEAGDKGRFFSLQAFSKAKNPPPIQPHTIVERPTPNNANAVKV